MINKQHVYIKELVKEGVIATQLECFVKLKGIGLPNIFQYNAGLCTIWLAGDYYDLSGRQCKRQRAVVFENYFKIYHETIEWRNTRQRKLTSDKHEKC